MTSVSEIPVVRVPVAAGAPDADDAPETTFGRWKAFDVPQPQRPSPVPLVLLALLAGIGAILLGAFAVVSATRSANGGDPPAAAKPAAVSAATPGVEQRVLALLAKPSTERVIFRGSDGSFVLAVGSAGRAAILVRGLERAPATRPLYAWVVRNGKPVRAARLTGAARAVFLSVPVARGQSVVVASERPAALPGAARIVAVRG